MSEIPKRKNEEMWEIMNKCNIYEHSILDGDFNHPIMMSGNDTHMRTQTYLLFEIRKLLLEMRDKKNESS